MYNDICISICLSELISRFILRGGFFIGRVLPSTFCLGGHVCCLLTARILFCGCVILNKEKENEIGMEQLLISRPHPLSVPILWL